MKIDISRRRKLTVVALLGAILFGIGAYAAVSNILAVGTIQDSELFNGPATVTVREFKIGVGETLAWHYHPGRAYNVIKSGVLTVEDGCGGPDETLTAGNAFEEVHGRVHRAKNLGVEEVVVYNTFIVPSGQPTTINIPGNERKCGPPLAVNDCANRGWVNFTHPRSFANQGDCEQYVITGK